MKKIYKIQLLSCFLTTASVHANVITTNASLQPTIVNNGFHDVLESRESSTLNLEDGTVGFLAQSVGTSTLNMMSGNLNRANSRGSSTFNMSGGSITEPVNRGPAIETYDSSVFNLSGGSVQRNVVTHGSSTLNVSGSNINGSVSISDSSTVNFSGGALSGSQPYIESFDLSTLNMSGGTVRSIHSFGNSTINQSGGILNSAGALGNSIYNLSGGSFVPSQRYSSRGSFPNFAVFDESIVNLYATDFGNYEAGSVFGYDDFAFADGTEFSRGNIFDLTFADGSKTSFDFQPNRNIDENGVISQLWFGSLNLIKVPSRSSVAVPDESSTAILLVLGIGGCIGFLRNRRHGKEL